MKKIAIFILALLAIGCMSIGLVACDKGSEESEYYLIADFESDDELLSINWFNMFGKVETSEEHVTSGEYSAKMEVHGYNVEVVGGAPAPMFKIYTNNEYNNRADYTQAVGFELDVYNDSDKDLELGFYFTSASFTEGGSSEVQTYTLKSKQMNHVEIEFERLYLDSFIDIAQISEFAFTLPLREAGEQPYVVYVDRFAAKLTDVPIDAVSFETITSYVGSGETFTVPVKDNTDWTIAYNGVIDESLNNAKSFVAQQGKYDIRYYQKSADRAFIAMNTLLVEEVENAVVFDKDNHESIGLPIPTLEEVTEGLPFGVQGIRLHGDNLGVDTGAMFKTGIHNNLEGLSFYILNNSSSAIDAIFNGTGNNGRLTMPAGQWSVFTQDAGLWNWYDVNHGLVGDKIASAYRDANGEWCFRIWLHGTGSYDVTVIAFFEKGDMPETGIVIDEEMTFAGLGETVVIPYAEGAHWSVSYAGEEIPGTKDAEDFVAEKLGTYVVNYTKTMSSGEVDERTYTVYVEDYDNAVRLDVDTAQGVSPHPQLEFELLNDGVFGPVTYRMFTDSNNANACVIVETDRVGDLLDLRFYIYNNESNTVQFMFNGTQDNGTTAIGPKTWVRFTQSAQIWNKHAEAYWKGENPSATVYQDRTTGKWIFSFWLTGAWYDVSIAAFMETSDSPSDPTINLDKEYANVQLGEAVTVPVVAGATWKVFKDGAEIAEFANQPSFTPTDAGIYTVQFTRETASAVYTVYVEDYGNAVEFKLDSAKPLAESLPQLVLTQNGEDSPFGTASYHVTVDSQDANAGVVINTGLTGDLVDLTIYVYNNANANVGLMINNGQEKVSTEPNTWQRIWQEPSVWNQYTDISAYPSAIVYKNEQGEWMFALWMTDGHYNAEIAIFFDNGD